MAAHSSVLAWRIPGMGSLADCRLWGRTELDTTEATQAAAAAENKENLTLSHTLKNYLPLVLLPDTSYLGFNRKLQSMLKSKT